MKERGDIAVGGDEYTFSITSGSGLETKPVGVENAHTYVRTLCGFQSVFKVEK